MTKALSLLKTIDELLTGVETDELSSLPIYADRIRTLAIFMKHDLTLKYRKVLDVNEQLQTNSIVENSIGKLCNLLDRFTEVIENNDEEYEDPDSDDLLTSMAQHLSQSNPTKDTTTAGVEPVELGLGPTNEDGVDDITSSASGVDADSLNSPRCQDQIEPVPERQGRWYSTKAEKKVRIKSPETSLQQENDLSPTSSPLPSERSANKTVPDATSNNQQDTAHLKTQIEKEWQQDGDLQDLVLAKSVQIGDRTVQLISPEYESEAEDQTKAEKLEN